MVSHLETHQKSFLIMISIDHLHHHSHSAALDGLCFIKQVHELVA